MPVPGPFTLAGRIDGGEVYPDRNAATEALIPIVNAELKALVAAGVDFIQIDEPSFSCHPYLTDHFIDVVARTVRGVRAYISMHMCFGNYRGCAVGHRLYRPLFPHIGRVAVNQLALSSPVASWRRSNCSGNCRRRWRSPWGWSMSRTPGSNRPSWSPPGSRPFSSMFLPSVSRSCRLRLLANARHIAVAKSKALVEGARIVRRSWRAEPESSEPGPVTVGGPRGCGR